MSQSSESVKYVSQVSHSVSPSSESVTGSQSKIKSVKEVSLVVQLGKSVK